MTSLRPAVELLVEERGDNASGVDATNFGDFGGGYGLFVRDYCKSFESGHGETQRRPKRFDEAAHDVMVLGLRVHLVAAGD